MKSDSYQHFCVRIQGAPYAAITVYLGRNVSYCACVREFHRIYSKYAQSSRSLQRELAVGSVEVAQKMAPYKIIKQGYMLKEPPMSKRGMRKVCVCVCMLHYSRLAGSS